MITRLDADVGRLLDTLERLGIDDNTLVLFTSDNGPHHEGGQDAERFDPERPAARVQARPVRRRHPRAVHRPLADKSIPAGSTSDHIGYLGDVFATLAELTKQPLPAEPRLHQHAADAHRAATTSRQQHEYLYWEFYEQGCKQAVRAENWKAVRMPMLTGKTELYDLESDLGETTNVAAEHPEVVRRLEQMMDAAHVADPNWKR